MAEFRIFRFDPDRNVTPRFDKFHVPVTKEMTVLEGLHHVFEEQDPSLSYRHSCGTGNCGSCAMHINGRPRLACQTVVAELQAWNVEIRPLPHFQVLKDLIVELKPMFQSLREVIPFLQSKKLPESGEQLQSPADRARIDPWVNCTLCGACNSACPPVATNGSYLGPAAMTNLLRWVDDSRDDFPEDRLGLADHDHGVFRCHNVGNCERGCTADLDPNKAVTTLRKRILRGKVASFFGKAKTQR